MNYELFSKLYLEALEHSNLDTYLNKQENQQWTNEFDYPDELLGSIYKLAYMSLQEIRESNEYSRSEFSRAYSIPVETLENWESLTSQAPVYVEILIAYTIFSR